MRVLLLSQSLIPPPFIGAMLDEVEKIPGVYFNACVLHSPPEPSFQKKLRRHWKKGVRGYLLVLFLQALYKKVSRKISKAPPRSFNLQTWLTQRDIPLLKISQLYSPESLQKIRDFNADVCILAGYHLIVKEPFIQLFPKGVLSYHYGDLSKYRGQPAGFWELYNGEKEFKVTVQKIREGIDNGIPVAEQRFEIYPHTTLRDLDKMVEQTSYTLMKVALQRILSPNYKDEIPEKYGKLYTLPDLHQWVLFQIKMAYRIMRAMF